MSLLYLLTESLAWLERAIAEGTVCVLLREGAELCRASPLIGRKRREFKISSSLTHFERARGEGTEIELESGRLKLNTHIHFQTYTPSRTHNRFDCVRHDFMRGGY